ncbi:hypothetical protein RI129_007377 [Pyrocoelia pectoralis]|uniref:Uncharacterized protein n=1 Tax=Pyrocoelia pectoralis TaxID=417401 RepID=A0AAN7ZH04_9COLE
MRLFPQDLVVSKPQHLQDQLQYRLDPLDQEIDYEAKDQGKRTIFPTRQYMFGKHVAIDGNGHKYLLGYSPLNVKYPPFFKPVAVFKPPIHSNNLVWKPMRQYLPPIIQAPNALNYDNTGWKPIIPAANPILHTQKPIVIPQQQQPVIDSGLIAKPVFAGVQPPVAVHQTPVHVKPFIPFKQPLHNYYFLQTPVAKPIVLPQQHLLQIARPELGVLPLGSAFPVPVSQSHHIHPPQIHHLGVSFPNPAHHPSLPIHPVQPPHSPNLFHPHQTIEQQIQIHNPQLLQHPQHHLGSGFPVPVHPSPPIHPVQPPHSPILFHPHQTIGQLPIHNPQLLHNPIHQPFPQQPSPEINHIHPVVPEHPQPLPPPPHHSVSFPVNFPPISVEFHGSPNLNPLNNQPHINPINTPLIPNIQSTQVIYGRQPHTVQFPTTHHIPHIANVNPINNPQEHPTQPQEPPKFLFDPAVQPGQSDLQIPAHLPTHPQFTTQLNEHAIHSQYLPLPEPDKLIKPAINLEPPFTQTQA